MPRVIWPILAVAVLAGLAWALVWAGGDRVVMAWALEGQRAAQTAMAGALRALRAGDMTAVTALWAIAFGYGFFHAVGPGHGKLVIGGYGAGTTVGAARLAGVALVASLAQAATAIALVGLGVALWSWGRTELTHLAEDIFAPLSFAAMALLGVWLAGRGVWAVWRLSRAPVTAQVCSTCGHAHGPDPEAVFAAERPRDLLALIAAVAIRPCTGALFLLILTAQMEIFWVGVTGTIAMALGTASVTVAVALVAVMARESVLSGLDRAQGRVAWAEAGLQLTVGALVALVAGQTALALI